MSVTKRIVCLAVSYKKHGYCVAGKEVYANGYGGWIRPVSNRITAELSISECGYSNYALPKTLDIIDIPLVAPLPRGHQRENYLIDPTKEWTLCGQLHFSELARMAETPSSLWTNSSSTTSGTLNCLYPNEAATHSSSLCLFKATDFHVVVGPHPFTGKRCYRGQFKVGVYTYSLSVTDPAAIRKLQILDDGDYYFEQYKGLYLTISLTEVFKDDNRCHKLIAAIITDPVL